MALKLMMVLSLSAFAIGGKLSQPPWRVRGQPPRAFLRPKTLKFSKPEDNGGNHGNAINVGPQDSGNKIIGGEEAPGTVWPWQALLEIKKTTGKSSICGGSLVAPNWVVTAAHCITDAASILVRLGVRNRSRPSPTEQKTHVTEAYWNGYKPLSNSHDIIMMKLARSVQLNNAVNLVSLPTSSGSVAIGTDCMVAGFGETSPKGASDVLMQVAVPIVSKKTCQGAYPSKQIDKSMICAGYAKGGKGFCSGDSGGPMVCEANGKFQLEGVVSWGYGCARPGKYGVYANVRYFRDWINSFISKN